jgi:hypothetical protein
MALSQRPKLPWGFQGRIVLPAELRLYLPAKELNVFRLLWKIRSFKDPEDVDEDEDEDGEEEGQDDGARGAADDDAGDDDDEEAVEEGPAPEDLRAEYLKGLVQLLMQLWSYTWKYIHQDECIAALQVATTYPPNLEDTSMRMLLSKLLLRNAQYQQSLLLTESIVRDFPRDERLFDALLSTAALNRRMGALDAAAALFGWVAGRLMLPHRSRHRSRAAVVVVFCCCCCFCWQSNGFPHRGTAVRSSRCAVPARMDMGGAVHAPPSGVAARGHATQGQRCNLEVSVCRPCHLPCRCKQKRSGTTSLRSAPQTCTRRCSRA